MTASTAEPDPDGINRYGNFLRKLGRLGSAEVMYERVVEMAPAFGGEWNAIAYGNLGNIYLTRGDLERAEEMNHLALEIYEQLGNRKGVARTYRNLGHIYLTQGDLERAEEAQRQALDVNKQLGSREGIGNSHGNLGNIYLTRGDLENAEEMQRQSLEIYEQLGSREGVARAYANLGVIYLTRRELDPAEKMQRQALEIYEQLGSREGSDAPTPTSLTSTRSAVRHNEPGPQLFAQRYCSKTWAQRTKLRRWRNSSPTSMMRRSDVGVHRCRRKSGRG